MTTFPQRPPADRVAKRGPAPLIPSEQRKAIAQLYNGLDPSQQAIAVELVAAFPRLVHGLARQGALATPFFDATSSAPQRRS